jgi:hypothetical protein
MPYGGFIQTISEKFEKLFSEISVEYNFDYGDEFEIALCKVLRTILPVKYGVCRGFATRFDGEKAGDDIIIFDQERFPTLRLLEDNTYAQKQHIPIEAIYAYIEAKHTLNIEGVDAQSLQHACEQVSQVKEVCNTRSARLLNQISPYLTLGRGVKFSSPMQFPKILNPMLGIVFARNAKRSKGEKSLLNDSQEIESLLIEQEITSKESPDIIVLGKNHVLLPIQHKLYPGAKVLSPFYIPGQSEYEVTIVDGIAFGIALISILDALDWVQLGIIPWAEVLASTLNSSKKTHGTHYG